MKDPGLWLTHPACQQGDRIVIVHVLPLRCYYCLSCMICSPHLPVTPVQQLMRSRKGQNTFCTVGNCITSRPRKVWFIDCSCSCTRMTAFVTVSINLLPLSLPLTVQVQLWAEKTSQSTTLQRRLSATWMPGQSSGGSRNPCTRGRGRRRRRSTNPHQQNPKQDNILFQVEAKKRKLKNSVSIPLFWLWE